MHKPSNPIVKRSIVAILAVAALLLAGCGWIGPQLVLTKYVVPCGVPFDAQFPVWSPDGKHIAYVVRPHVWTDIGGPTYSDIYVVNSDGTSQTRLTNDPIGYGSSSPGWSPDGRQIAFDSLRSGTIQIYVMNSDGSDQTQLTSDANTNASAPSWSPDGKQIIFQAGPSAQIYKIELSSKHLSRLADPGFYLNISPDGKYIAYGDSKGNLDRIFKMNSDGSGQTMLTNDPILNDRSPVWSPDGKHIAFVSWGFQIEDIYVINADGTGRTRLTDDPAINDDPAWSPDGSHIAFTRDGDDGEHIYVMAADGSDQKMLAKDGYSPAWSRDGKRIAFGSHRDGQNEIYIMNADGSAQTRLTFSGSTPACPPTPLP